MLVPPADRRRGLDGLIQRWIARTFAGHGGPTSDLYFCNACQDAIARGDVQQLSATVFASETALLVLRHGAGFDLQKALRGRTRLIWFCDDDIDAGCADRSLPGLHRLKLALVDRWAARRIGAQADAVVLSTDRLAAMAEQVAPSRPVHVIAPFWSEPALPLDHFHSPKTVEIGFLGAQTHAADLLPYLTVIEDVLARNDNVRFHVSSGHRLPSGLAGHERVVQITPLRWQNYRTQMGQVRYHILLYPLAATPFNRARSINKIIEHGLLGGAAIYTETWPEAARIADAGAGIVLPDDKAAWQAAIQRLVEDVTSGGHETRRLAEAGQKLAKTLNLAAPQRTLWAGLLDVPTLAGPAS